MSPLGDEIAQGEFAFVLWLFGAYIFRVGYCVALALDDEAVEVRIGPAHDDLQDAVELGEGGIALHLDAAPDGGLGALKGDFELVYLVRFLCALVHPFPLSISDVQDIVCLGVQKKGEKTAGGGGLKGYLPLSLIIFSIMFPPR